MKNFKILVKGGTLVLAISAILSLSACASGSYGTGYRTTGPYSNNTYRTTGYSAPYSNTYRTTGYSSPYYNTSYKPSYGPFNAYSTSYSAPYYNTTYRTGYCGGAYRTGYCGAYYNPYRTGYGAPYYNAYRVR